MEVLEIIYHGYTLSDSAISYVSTEHWPENLYIKGPIRCILSCYEVDDVNNNDNDINNNLGMNMDNRRGFKLKHNPSKHPSNKWLDKCPGIKLLMTKQISYSLCIYEIPNNY